MKKHIREVKKLAAKFDRDVVQRRRGHLSLVCRRGERAPIFTSLSSGDHRMMKNLETHLRHSDETTNSSKKTG